MWGIVSAIMSTIMEWVSKLTERLKPHNEAHIQIGPHTPNASSQRLDAPISPRSQNAPSQRSSDAPRIVIKRIHHYPPTYSSDVAVAHRNLGHGIKVTHMRKPVRCPMCATRGRIVENGAESAHRWKCEECQSTFN